MSFLKSPGFVIIAILVLAAICSVPVSTPEELSLPLTHNGPASPLSRLLGFIDGYLEPNSKTLITTYEHATSRQLWRVRALIGAYSDGNSKLPEGDVNALEAWIEELCKDPYAKGVVEGLIEEGMLKTSEDGHMHLVDHWGHSIVYRYPSGSPKYVFRLYSVGFNGIDDGGGGDDVDASPLK
jgi:hypothetical protein